MLKTILKLNGIKLLSEVETRKLLSKDKLCRKNGMCSEYGSQCAELACKDVPKFENDLME